MLKIVPRPSVASKKTHERSEFIVAFDFALDFAFAFSQIHGNMNQKLLLESSESEIQ